MVPKNILFNAYDNWEDFPDRSRLIHEGNAKQETTHVKIGNPAEIIVEVADAIYPDAMVIGTLARSGVIAAMRDNKSEDIIHKLNRDVLVINSDEMVRGLMVICRKTTKTYSVQGDVRRNGRHIRTVRVKVDQVDRIGLRDARRQARQLMSTIQSEVDPSSKPEETGITLANAYDTHITIWSDIFQMFLD